MKRHTTFRRASAAALGASALGALGILMLGTAAQAQAKYLITVDTSSLAGTAGNLDFQFNPGSSGGPAALLQVSGFTTTGALAGTASDTGGATGTLPGTLSIANTGSFNDVFQGTTFGSSLSFFATFSGPALGQNQDGKIGNTFAFSLYDAAGTTPLLATNPDGSVLDATIGIFGRLAFQDASPPVTVEFLNPIPEASPALSLGLLLALGAGGLIATRRKRVRA